MTKTAYKVRDDDDTVIAQFYSNSNPDRPDEYDGEWIVEDVELSDLNSEPVEWWGEQ